MKKPAIPPTNSADRFSYSVKEILETYQGLRGSKITLLPTTATDAQVISKINELIELLQ